MASNAASLSQQKMDSDKCISKRVGVQNYEEYCNSQEAAVDQCDESSVCDLDPCHFWKHVGRQKYVFLLFYAPWCTLSQDFIRGPFAKIQNYFKGSDDILVAKMDAS